MEFEKIWSKKQMDEILSSPNYMTPIYDDLAASREGKRLLDIGCGNGYFTSYLKKYDFLLHGVDGSEYGVEESLKNGFDKCLLVKNFDSDEIKVEVHYDFIICKDVLEHVLFPEQLMAKAREQLTKTGLFFVLIPNHFTLYHRFLFLFSGDIDVPKYFPDSPKWSYPHIRFMKHQDLVKLCEHSGFKIEKDYSFQFSFVLPRGNGLFKKLGISDFLAKKFPNLFSTAFAVSLSKL
jgi:2-polyprenyl-3-methyl-5-hydroxy-6-metoxy-1,4-benzoquinol methylase